MEHSYLFHTLYLFLAGAASMAVLLLLLLAVGSLLSHTRWFRRLSLPEVQTVQQGYIAPQYAATLLGQHGTAQTPLRPAGKVRIQGHTYQATAMDTYIAPQAPVVVTAIMGHTLVVEPAAPA